MAIEAVWRGEYYSENSQSQERWHRALLSSVSFRGDEEVLDLGCGDGRLTAQYCALASSGHVLGVDSSQSMISWAGTKYGALPNVTFRVQDIANFSYRGTFDLVFSSSCLHWVPDHRTVIHRIARSLKTGGRFVLLFSTSKSPLNPIHQAIEETLASSRWRSHFIGFGQTAFSFPQRDYEKWALEARVPHFSISEIDTEDHFENLDSFVAWMKGWLQPLKRLHPCLHDPFVEEVGFRYLQYPDTQDPQGVVHFPQSLFLLKGSV